MPRYSAMLDRVWTASTRGRERVLDLLFPPAWRGVW